MREYRLLICIQIKGSSKERERSDRKINVISKLVKMNNGIH